ncbi:MAG: TRAP transporter small permease subunit [Alphaproteobacteria bacterium]|nr:TRAP transporter small permease subunit [Alphaproteobacteria bacterium SS10]
MTGFLALLVKFIDGMNDRIGRGVSWLMLGMVLMTCFVVVLRYAILANMDPWLEAEWFAFLFGGPLIWLRENYVKLQESYVWMHGITFMVGAGYTLLHDGHVRVDIFYRGASPKYQAKVNLFGCLFLLIPVLCVIGYYSYPYVADSWEKLEESREAGGLPGLFLLKSMLLVFVALTMMQAISMMARSILVLTNHPEFAPPAEEHEGI